VHWCTSGEGDAPHVLSDSAVNGAGITTLMHAVVAARTVTPPAQISLPGIPASVSAARRFAAAALGDCPRADDLVLAASELASNAVGHSASGEGGSFMVAVRTAPRWARVEVSDSGPALLPSAARNGWGLQIVAAVADRSGAIIRPEGSRIAFAEATWPLP
jgi:Histidine kinase-like ATPase domain